MTDTIALLKSAGLVQRPRRELSQPGQTRRRARQTANVEHQQWFADATTKAILPAFAKSPEPFLLVFWSGDPDQTQHAQGDSLNQLTPGINGADVEVGRSECRPESEADSRLSRCASRGTRQHECVRDVRSWVLDGQPARDRCVRPSDEQLFGDAALSGRVRPAGGERRPSAAGISRHRSRAPPQPAVVRP